MQLASLLVIHKAMNLTFLRFSRLKSFFQQDWERCLRASEQEIFSAGIDKLGAEKFFHLRKSFSPEEEILRLEKLSVHVLVWGNPNYPSPLSTIAQPPVILFVRGKIKEEDFPSLAIVGSRIPTNYGKRVLEHFLQTIAFQRITVVSGLALGIDTIAHEQAIAHGTRTIAVLGSGIDLFYPRANERFAKKFLEEEKGVIVSEYFPGMEPCPEYFPVRNRIIAGLSRATLVIEAGEKSGSLITAQFALEEAREVFAVPGDIFSRLSKGTHALLFQGAQLATSPETVLACFDVKKSTFQQEARNQLALSEIEQQILQLFHTEQRRHINDLIHDSNLSSATITAQVSLLEIKGLLKNIGNQIFEKHV